MNFITTQLIEIVPQCQGQVYILYHHHGTNPLPVSTNGGSTKDPAIGC